MARRCAAVTMGQTEQLEDHHDRERLMIDCDSFRSRNPQGGRGYGQRGHGGAQAFEEGGADLVRERRDVQQSFRQEAAG